MCNCEHVSVTVYSCKRGERKRKENFEVSNSSLVGCGTVSTGKRRLSWGEYCSHFLGAHSGVTVDFYLKKMVVFVCLSIPNYWFTDTIRIFTTPSFIMTITTFICWKSSYFPNFFVTTALWVVNINFHFLYFAWCSFLPYVRKPVLLWVVLQVFFFKI